MKVSQRLRKVSLRVYDLKGNGKVNFVIEKTEGESDTIERQVTERVLYIVQGNHI